MCSDITASEIQKVEAFNKYRVSVINDGDDNKYILSLFRYMAENNYSMEIVLMVGHKAKYVVAFLCPETGTYTAFISKKTKWSGMKSIDAIKERYDKDSGKKLEVLQECYLK
jgi:hypothetical protein